MVDARPIKPPKEEDAMTAIAMPGTGRQQSSGVADEEFNTRFHSELIPLLDPLYEHAIRLTCNRADAEDLLQDTMVKACVSWRSGKQSISTQRRNPVCYMSGFTAETAVTQHSVEEQTLNMLGHSEIRSAMYALPEEFRLAVYYADVEGLRCREIADLMLTPMGTVASRLHRGRLLLRRLLADLAEQRGYGPIAQPA
jgi:RNA polymerase sigma-70 factor (ECF subfamily)